MPLSRQAHLLHCLGGLGAPHLPLLNTPWTLVLRELRKTTQEDPSQSGRHAGDGHACHLVHRALGGGPGSRPSATNLSHLLTPLQVQPLQPETQTGPGRPGGTRRGHGGPRADGEDSWAPDGIAADRPGLRHVTQQGCLRCPQPPLSMHDATPPDSLAAEARDCGRGESGTGRPSAQGEGPMDDPDVTVPEPCHPN